MNATPRATVCLTVDFDAVSIWMQWGARGIRALSRGEFGARVAAPRLLDLFEKHGVTSTWFVPGHTVDTWPEVTARVAASGHEIANHGYLHEEFEGRDVESSRALLRKANESIERVAGRRPVGFRLPAGDADQGFLELLVEEGFEYDSSLLADDFSPYWARGRDELHETGPNVLGDEIDLVEIPFTYAMSDFHHFESSDGTPPLFGHDAPSSVEEIYRGQFDYMYENVPGGMLMLMCHPQSIGHGHRIAMLDRWIEYCMAHPGTRFTTLETLAAEFRVKNAPQIAVAGS